MERIRQIRDVIWERGKEDRRQRLRVEEIKVQAITSAIYGAAGNASGARAALGFRLTGHEPVVAPTAQVKRLFPVDPAFGLITPEMIAAEQARQAAEGGGDR